MKNKIFKKKAACFATMLVCMLSALQSIAQVAKELHCREPYVSREQVNKMIEYRKQNANRALAGNIQVRVYFHILSDDDGTFQGALPAEVDKELDTMKSDFAGAGICFIYAGLNYIANSLLNHINVDTHSDADDLFRAHNISGCLNIYYVYEIRGTNSASGGNIGGITFDSPGTFCLVGNESLGGHTSSHETGHCFGLFHTFAVKGLGLENISGSNCGVAGDLICDTEADPYAFKAANENCYSQNDNGFYTGTCEDPEGHSNYSPPYHNIMAYLRHNPLSFTSAQLNAMLSTIENESDLQDIISQNDITIFPQTNNFGFIYKSAINSITTVGEVNYLNLTEAGLFAKKVILTAGFHAQPATGHVQIKAYECSGSSALIASGSSTSAVTKNEMQKSITNLLVFPNPSTGTFTVQYSSKEKFTASVIVRNMMGVIVYTIPQKQYYGSLQEKINISGKPKGIYMVEIVSGEKRITTKILIQ